MPDLNDLQTEYDELTRTIERQNELRNSGSDDYDWNKLDEANNRRNQVQRSIEEAGGTPGGNQPPADSPSGGQGSPATEQPPGAPDPGESTIGQLEHQLGQLRDNPPHPGVRMEDGKVVGGTAEDFQEQLEWRAQIERLDHELTAAQADKAWAEAGGPDGFTDAEIEAIERAGEKIDAIQDRLDAVQSQIDDMNARLDEARGVLDGQTTQGGGPNAASAAAVAVGARIMGELRDLEAQKAAIQQELSEALEALATIIRTRVRTQLEGSGLEVGLPGDRKGKAAVEDAFLRRVYRRLGLDYLPFGASGLLQGLSGAQSQRTESRLGMLALVAVVAIVAIGLVVLLLLRGDDVSTPVVAIPQPTTTQTTETSAVADETPTSTAVAIPSDDADVTDADAQDVEPAPPAVATSIGIPYSCAEVIHSSLVGFSNSLSYFMLSMLVGGVDGTIPEGTTLTVDAGGLAPNSAPISGYLADVPIPIDHYGSYPVTSITADGPDGPIEVQFLIEPIIVDSSEGSVGDCEAPAEALASGGDFAGGFGGDLWFDDGPPAQPADPTDGPDTAEFQVFLDNLSLAHQMGDVDALLGALDPATINRYGSDQCRAYLGEVAGSFADPTLVSASAEPWDYLTDGVSTTVPDAWNLLIDVTLGGTKQQVPMHVRPLDDEIYWFTDCGQPSG